jgi:phage gp36-like protein
MAFLEQQDLYTQNKQVHFEELIADDPGVLDTVFQVAESRIMSAGMATYDMKYELGRSGRARNAELIWHCTNLVMYQLNKRLPQSQRDPDITTDYEETLAWLKQLRSGDITLPLRAASTFEGTEGQSVNDSPGFVMASSKKRRY